MINKYKNRMMDDKKVKVKNADRYIRPKSVVKPRRRG